MTRCRYCGAAREQGIRTCGPLCPRGVDPRLARFLGVANWVVVGRVHREDVQ